MESQDILKPDMVLGHTFSIKPQSQKRHVEQNENKQRQFKACATLGRINVLDLCQ